MENEFKVLPRGVIYLFLWIGLSAAIAVRSLMILNRFNPAAAVWVWRFAMLSYSIFFGYRLIIGRRRRRAIVTKNLISKLKGDRPLDPATRAATVYILESIMRSKELFNYAFICLLSLIAFVIDFFID
ncbi:MAG: hypothetical protein KJN98_01245 [Pontiella sp.]|nr:hypothetical protein [Pontiella sp.]